MRGEATRIVFLPGLGADARLFDPQLAALPGSVCVDWPSFPAEGTVSALADRCAERLDTSAAVLCGFSFGGMVALEIAARVASERRPAGVVLLSGLRSWRAVSRAFRLQQAVGTRVPRALASAVIAGPLASVVARRERLDAERSAVLRSMAADADVGFLFRAARACASWRFDGRCPVPVAHAHGRRDRIIPYVPHPDLPGGEATLLDAGHLITWTAAEAVTAFVAEAASAMTAAAATMPAGLKAGDPS